MEDSAELKTLRSAYDHLVNTISVDSVLPAARAAELITVRDYENCKAEPTACKQAEIFVVCVEKAVIAYPGNFDSFLSILGQCGQKSIAEYLRKHYLISTSSNKCGSLSNTIPMIAAVITVLVTHHQHALNSYNFSLSKNTCRVSRDCQSSLVTLAYSYIKLQVWVLIEYIVQYL